MENERLCYHWHRGKGNTGRGIPPNRKVVIAKWSDLLRVYIQFKRTTRNIGAIIEEKGKFHRNFIKYQNAR